MLRADDYDLRAITPTVAKILDVIVPFGTEVDPISEVLEGIPSAERLVLVVIDGFGSALWKYVRHAVPTINRIAELRQMEIASVMPSTTYVCISSMLTGTSPNRHGVTNLNDAISAADDPGINTLFDVVKCKGQETLMAVHRKGVAGLPLERLVDQAIVVEEANDDEIYKQVPELICTHRFGFAFVHLIDIDEAAHSYGPYTSEVKSAASKMDYHLGKLLACFAKRGYAIMVVADHGMHKIPRADMEGYTGNHDGSVEEDRVVPLFWASAEEFLNGVVGEN